ncbi:MAG: rRNA maturation RNase YbeY [Clostridiales Family XIII bacterium]|jgi:probable rRNA maturation factor|nr:rRNA maturation RNase YbeY [Clostridiales Family XIII bacterium]
MKIIFSDERMPGEKVIGLMTEAGSLCAAEKGLDPSGIEVSVTFVGTDEMRELNHAHRGSDAITDVLSFPQYGAGEEIPAGDEIPAGSCVSIGDVVICSEQALLQADDFGHTPERELVYLFVHSLFHLLGYDHGTGGERAEMRGAEERIMERLGLARD